MLEYKNKDNLELVNIISDYLTIQMLDPNVEGVYLSAYYDDCNCFEIGTFYKENKNTNTTLSSYKVDDSMITFYNFDLDDLDFLYDFSNYIILFDRNKHLFNKYEETSKNAEYGKLVIPSNYLRIPSEFIIDIQNANDEKMSKVDMNDLEGSICVLLTDYYINIINKFNYEDLIKSIKRHIMLSGGQEELHSKALDEAIGGKIYIKNL